MIYGVRKESLIQWTLYIASSCGASQHDNNNDDAQEDILTRLFVFDSFEEHFTKEM